MDFLNRKRDMKKPFEIHIAHHSDYPKLIDIWESSVRATHDFLSEEDILQLKPLILDHYFDAVDLCIAKTDDGEIVGFCGTHHDKIEMLFIAPEARGKGAGTQLVTHAIDQQKATTVDVNEQNKQALQFYLHIGFSVIDRSPIDGQGRPYPLLHLTLTNRA